MFHIESSALPDDARAVAFDGVEALCRPYRYDVFITTPDATSLDRADAVGAKISLSMTHGTRDEGAVAKVSGIIASVSLLHTFGEGGLYKVVLVPRLQMLAQGRYSRLFTKKSIADIIKEVLDDEGAGDFELRLQGSYDKEEHVCQYRESHLDFLHRWMESEGIYYFFEQGEDGEKLIVTDDRSAHAPLLQKPIAVSAGGHSGKLTDAIDAFTTRQRGLPQAIRVSDYDYLKPELDMSARADVSPTGTGEIWVHAGRYFTPAKAKAMAKIRAEEHTCREIQHLAVGSSFGLRAGWLFELEGHRVGRLDAKYLVTECRISGRTEGMTDEVRTLCGLSGKDSYRVRATAIDSQLQFRPRRVTPWPRVHGFENGTVDGPANSEYAQIDDHGRYLVKLRFDDSSLKHGDASTWVRMLQPHGGGVEGWHFPLRKGTEVVFQFLDGDPDRPVIAGMAPNALTPSPVTSKNHTTNVVQTGGLNRLEIEDLSGTQRMSLSTPTESTMIRLGAPNDDCNARLFSCGVGRLQEGQNMTMITHGAKREEDKNRIDEQYRGAFSTTVTNDTTETYNATKSEEVTGELTQIYKTSQTVTVTGPVSEIYQQKHETTVAEARTENLDSTVDETYGSLKTEVTKKVTDRYNADCYVSVSSAMTHNVSGKYTRQAANIDDQVLLNIETKGEWCKLTIALSSETFVVRKAEMTLGVKFEIIKPFKLEATMAMLLEQMGVKCGFWATKTDTEAAKNDDGASVTEAGAAETTNAAVSVESGNKVEA